MTAGPFVVVSNARCGTHMVRTAISSHPELTCYREVFGMGGFGPITPERLYDKHTGPGIGFCVHAETIPGARYSANVAALWGIMERERPAIIVVERRDQLRRQASLINVRRMKAWHHGEHREHDPPAIHLDPYGFVARVTRYNDSMLMVRRRFADALWLFYEDFLDDWTGQCEAAVRKIGARPHPLVASVARQERRPVRDILSNYDGLKARFQGTDYERYFGIAETNDNATVVRKR